MRASAAGYRGPRGLGGGVQRPLGALAAGEALDLAGKQCLRQIVTHFDTGRLQKGRPMAQNAVFMLGLTVSLLAGKEEKPMFD